MKDNYYDDIALDYHLKRKYSWRPLEDYIQEQRNKGFEFYGLSLDIGCANGRHFKLFKKDINVLVGIDNSFEFLKIAVENVSNERSNSNEIFQHVHVIKANVLNLLLRTNIAHNVFSIATIHHLKNKVQRFKAIKQISEILKNKGFFLITVWRKYQKKYRNYFIIDKLKRIFIPTYKKTQESMGFKFHGDMHVPWTLSKNSKTYQRFYHFFSKRELKKLLKEFNIVDISKKGGSTNKDNFFVVSKVRAINDIPRN